MAYTKKIEFANFTCIFGERLVLLDMFDDVIYPAFEEKKHNRSYMDSDYFFLDTQLVQVKDKKQGLQIGIAGKIVKNTKLKREQIFREGTGIIEDHDEMESAPTSMFVLILNNHRLLYVKEVPGAPDLTAFKATCAKFFKIEHKNFINRIWEHNKAKREKNKSIERLTKMKLVQMYPYPDLRITPLTDPQGLKQFLDKFSKIGRLGISLVPTNSETLDNDGFWKDLEKADNQIGAKRTTVTFNNKSDGLNSEEVFKHCEKASKLANSKLNLNGVDKHGGTLKGNNEDFSLTMDTDEDDLSRRVSKAGPGLMTTFYHLIDTGSIALPPVSIKVVEKITEIFGRYFS